MMFIKRIITWMTVLVTIISGFFGIEVNLPAKKAESFKVTSYVVSDYIQSPSALYPEDFDIITDVILFGCATFDTEGKVNLEKQELETALYNLRQAIGDRDVAITLNLLGPGATTDSQIWEEQMQSQTDNHNKAFTSGMLGKNIKQVLKQYDFDGVHFDYEYPVSLNAHVYYNAFLMGLDKTLGDEYTIGIASNEWNLYLVSPALASIDSIEMMMYDFYDEEGRHSTFETATELAREIELFGVPLEMVNFGIPFYARPSDQSTYWYGYDGCYDKLDSDNWYYDETIDKSFWFHTPEVVYKKTDWAIDKGYGGIMIWHYKCDIPSSHEASLLASASRAIADNY